MSSNRIKYFYSAVKNNLFIIIASSFVIGMVVFMMTLSTAMPPSKEVARFSCERNLMQIGSGLAVYASLNNGYYPLESGDNGLKVIFTQKFLENRRIYLCTGDTWKTSSKTLEDKFV